MRQTATAKLNVLRERFCGEGACSRWTAQQALSIQLCNTKKICIPILRLLPSRAGASSLATKSPARTISSV
ncbi:hypothetical protein EMIT0P258_20581 [Pseudomonas sp. IT-P258]